MRWHDQFTWRFGPEGAQQVASHNEIGLVNRVLLLSDGCANEGLTDVDRICQQVQSLADRGITTSTYGLGTHFNGDLMVQWLGLVAVILTMAS